MRPPAEIGQKLSKKKKTNKKKPRKMSKTKDERGPAVRAASRRKWVAEITSPNVEKNTNKQITSAPNKRTRRRKRRKRRRRKKEEEEEEKEESTVGGSVRFPGPRCRRFKKKNEIKKHKERKGRKKKINRVPRSKLETRKEKPCHVTVSLFSLPLSLFIYLFLSVARFSFTRRNE